jgi:hypothetical protein
MVWFMAEPESDLVCIQLYNENSPRAFISMLFRSGIPLQQKMQNKIPCLRQAGHLKHMGMTGFIIWNKQMTINEAQITFLLKGRR